MPLHLCELRERTEKNIEEREVRKKIESPCQVFFRRQCHRHIRVSNYFRLRVKDDYKMKTNNHVIVSSRMLESLGIDSNSLSLGAVN